MWLAAMKRKEKKRGTQQTMQKMKMKGLEKEKKTTEDGVGNGEERSSLSFINSMDRRENERIGWWIQGGCGT